MFNEPSQFESHGIVDPNRCVRMQLASDLAIGLTKGGSEVRENVQTPVYPSLQPLKFSQCFPCAPMRESTTSIDQFCLLVVTHGDGHCIGVHFEAYNRDTGSANLFLFLVRQPDLIP